MYSAIYCPADKANENKHGFASEFAAWKYILENHCCSGCLKEDPVHGYACGAEWMVTTTWPEDDGYPTWDHMEEEVKFRKNTKKCKSKLAYNFLVDKGD